MSRNAFITGVCCAAWIAAAPAAAAQQRLTADAGFARQALAACPTDLRWLNQIGGWQVQWATALESRPVATAEQRATLLERWRAAPAALAEAMDSLRAGLREGRGAPPPVVRRVLDQIDGLLTATADESALTSPARRSGDAAFRRDWRALLDREIRPAIRAFRDDLREQYLPATRTALGVGALPEGEACFDAVVEAWTTLRLEPDEIEALGRRHLARLERELLERAAPRYGADRREILDRLREGEFVGGFDSRDDVVGHAEAAIERAQRALPDWFATPGSAPIVVAPMPRNLEASFPAGLYRPGAGPDEPARYVVNTSRPRDRRLLSEVIAFHEAVPGHHTSAAVPAAAGNAPGPFNSGFAEGWAIYAERLAAEMGLYSSTLDRIGLVTKHLWATSRLIVEPGIHLRGWSRDRAIAFMLEHTALPRAEIELEVDRYIALPGQSLAYMLGNLELRRMRERAEQRMGERFDVREFHDVVLAPGRRPLPEVAADVADWSTSGA